MNEGLGLWITFSILHYGYTEYLLNIKSLSIRYLSNIASCVMKFFTLPSLIPPGHLPPKLSLFVKMEKSHFITSLCIRPQPGPGGAWCRELELSGQLYSGQAAPPPGAGSAATGGQRRKLVKTQTGSNIITVQHSSQKARSFKHSLHTAEHCSLCSHMVAVVAPYTRSE